VNDDATRVFRFSFFGKRHLGGSLALVRFGTPVLLSSPQAHVCLNAPFRRDALFSSGNNGHARQSGARVLGRGLAPTRLAPPRDGFHAPWRRAIGTSKPDRWRRDRAVATRDARLRATKRDGPPGMRPRVAVRRDARGVRRVRVAAKHAGVPRVRREVSSRHTLLRHLRPARGARRARPQLRAGRCASANGTRSTPTPYNVFF
jgi:hypothetical protein